MVTRTKVQFTSLAATEVIMSTDSGWLPQLMLFAQFDGKWELYLEAIYRAFCDDFIHSKPAYPGKRFAVKRMPLALEKEATFWHLIQ